VVTSEGESAPVGLAADQGRAVQPHGRPLPPGWIALQDPTGRVYYQNQTSKTTQWDHPSSLPPGWVALRDDNGATFYQNNATHITQWEHPGLTSPPGPSSHAVGNAIKAVQRALPLALLKDVYGSNATFHLGDRYPPPSFHNATILEHLCIIMLVSLYLWPATCFVVISLLWFYHVWLVSRQVTCA
jgi:hypothetical protein